MRLYEVPRNTWVKVLKAEDSPPDGMYSYCRNKAGQVIHLKAWTEVELVTDVT